MSLKELVAEIRRLPLDERLLLLEVLSHDIRETLQHSTVSRVEGILKPDDAEELDDETLRQDYINYLEAKYR